ncbi:hypothetical protein [Sphingomonas corticis]|jgi:hypothetical protein|uniref:DUF2746 domain-containing protein n=1 Tax=Sphingomonas corticis TaxID=2722791 RepID=A0ABX1CRL3_9SPHN|nr:hypothetical protein [Sphingomonas corticis]NJR79451.1 hypothetical protein [Sphingomonas corticis]
MEPGVFELLRFILPIAALIVAMGVGGSVFSTWLRIRNGYPLENSWGKAIHPQRNEEQAQRITLLSQENAQLRAELGSVKDRLQNVERIVTDGSLRLSHEIDALRGPAN